MSNGPTRRLPAWIPAAPAVVKPANVILPRVHTAGSVDVSRETDEQCSPVRPGDEPRRRRRMKSNEHETLLLAGRQRRGRKRKSSEEAETDDCADDVVSNTGAMRRELRGQVPVPRRRRNVKLEGRQVDRGSDTTSLHDDEIELTVEDLLTIAEEYTKSYDDALRSLGESTLECGGRLTAPENVDGSHHHSTSARTEKSSEGGSGKVVEDLIDEEAANKSGYPAQEMLDLLLGPLLKEA